MVGQRASAEDIAQEAFLRAWRSIDRFDGRAAFGTWLYRITMNLCLTELRSRARRQVREAGPASDSVRGPDGEPSPTEGVETEEAASVAARALELVSDEHRAILLLRDVRGLEYGAIAEALQIAPGTVKSRLFRARAALRDVMKHTERSPREGRAQ